MLELTRLKQLVILLNIMLLSLAAPALAHALSELSLNDAEQLALTDEPGILAAQARAHSMTNQSVSAGALPDPEVSLGVINLPLGSYRFEQEPMTQKQIGFRQTFPPVGSRKAMQQQIQYQGDAFNYHAMARSRQVVRSVRYAWLDTYYWQQAQRIVSENRILFGHLVKVARSLYSVGRQNQQDVVRAELELSRLDDRLLDVDTQVRRSRAELAQWVGATDAQRRLPETLPDWQGYHQLASLYIALLQHPLLAAIDANVSAATAGVDVARAKYKPKIGFDVKYGMREDDLLGQSRDDFLSTMVTFSVPLFTSKRQDKEVDAAEQIRYANLNERDMLLRDLRRQLESAHAQWQQLRFRISLHDDTILQQSRIQAEATLQAYQNGIGDFADVMHAYISDLNTQLNFIRLKTDYAKTYAQLDYLVGHSLEDDKSHD